MHSFVAAAAYEELSVTGVLRCRHEHVDPVDGYAYDWMRGQVVRRLVAVPGTWPIWVWARTTRRHLVDAAHAYARVSPGTVLVTCRLPRSRVLLSEFEDWHCVLNGGPVFPRSLTDADVDVAFDAWGARSGRLVPVETAPRTEWPKEVLDELHESWDAIFDVHAYPRGSVWQGCVAELRTDDVIDAVQLDLSA